MKIDSATWSRIAELFDSLVDLTPEQRQRFLEETAPPGEIRREVTRLLEAHDHPDPLLLDQSVDDIVFDMLGDTADILEAIPANLEGRYFGNWQATEEIGRGGMSVVLRGQRADGQFEKQTAIKLLPPGPVGAARRARFQSELRLLARLEHPGIARLLDGGVSDQDIPYLVMEHVEGAPITRYAEERELDLEQRLELFIQAAEAIAYSHQKLIVHCDIKPGNVLVTGDNQVKLVDFGIASMLSDHAEDEEAGRIPHCSPAYAAPEQLAGETPTVAQDVFGLGALLYELMSGRRIRGMQDATGVLFGRTVRDHIPPPSGMATLRHVSANQLSPDLDAICMKALARNPQDRYGSVGEMLADIANWRNHQPVGAVAGGHAYRTGKWLLRNRWTAAAAGIVALSISAGGALAVWQAQQARASADLARLESARAEMALAESRQALARSEALRDFLLDLFSSAQPDRPSDQLPSTESLLAHGARQALDEASAPPVERYEMLMAIGGVYMGLDQTDDARPLFKAAIELARVENGLDDDELVRAISQLASMEEKLYRLSEAERHLDAAEDILAQSDVSWNIAAQTRNLRGRVEARRGNAESAIAILAPLHEELESRSSVPARIRGDIKRDLGSAYRYAGNLEAAAELRLEVKDIFREHMGEESLDYAISLINLAIIEHTLGDYDSAENRAREALALFHRIFDGPSDFSASTNSNLGLMLYYQGRFNEALDAMERGVRQRAEILGKDIDNYDRFHYQRGTMLASMGRWEEAEASLTRAHELFSNSPDVNYGHFALLEAALARVKCEQQHLEDGRSTLASMMNRLGEKLPENPKELAAVHVAHAVCAFKGGDNSAALTAVDHALEAEPDAGQGPDMASKRLLRARILTAMGQEQEAGEMLDEAESRLLELGLDNHPYHSDIHAARREIR